MSFLDMMNRWLRPQREPQASAPAIWRPKVVVADAVSDGNGGYYPVGARIDAAPETAAALLARGLVE